MSKSNVVSPTHQNDLREFIAAVEQRGELARVANAHWDKELGAVTEVLYRQKVEKAPMLLFDEIPGYPKGYRCAYGMFGSPYRLAHGARHGAVLVRRPDGHAQSLPRLHQEGLQADSAAHGAGRAGAGEHRPRQ